MRGLIDSAATYLNVGPELVEGHMGLRPFGKLTAQPEREFQVHSGRINMVMGAAVRRTGFLCIVLAATCAGAGEPPAAAPSSAFAIEQMLRNGDPAVAGQAPERPLDVATLKLRLRETTSIGVFAKLALRNEMDRLMQQLRWHHEGNNKISVADLRLLYDQLVFKVLSLIWDGDPPLAHAIARSRESIWSVLVDPEQFESMG